MRPYPKNDLNGRIFRHAQNFNILIQKLKIINKHLVKKIKQKIIVAILLCLILLLLRCKSKLYFVK